MDQITFLIIDDDDEDRQWLIETIKQMVPSPSFVEVRHGREALQKLREGLKPHVIFVDLNMPVMDGIQFLSTLLADPSLNTIPVVVMSTSSNPVITEEVKSLGVSSYITKPNTEIELFNEVFKALVAIWTGTPAINLRNRT